MSSMEFWSADGVFGLRISDDVLKELQSRCGEAGKMETGCILVGYYDRGNTLAVVSELPETPKDSIAGSTYFDRGIGGLRKALKRYWRKRHFYIGEWHYHPHAAPTASAQDHQQMSEVARDARYRCPEPLLLIVGGSGNCWDFSVHVYPNGRPMPLSARREEYFSAGAPSLEP